MAQAQIPLFKVFTADTVHAALEPVLQSGWLAPGQQVVKFETGLAEWLGVSGAVGLSDASGGLTMAMYMAGVRPGTEVIVSPLTCAATVMPIANLFARPVWCDIDPRTGMIDPAKIAALITEKTRAVLLYHWSGNVADVCAVAAVAKQHGIKLIQDASEAFGAEYRNQRLGGETDFTIYSFYATKHINCGEGAALLAAAPADLEMAVRLRRFGIDYSLLRMANADLNPNLDIPVAGFNLVMNEIAATLGIEGMRHADEIVNSHRANGRFYESALANVSGVRLLKQLDATVSGYWVYSLLAERRDDLVRKLVAHGIGAQRLHLRADGYSCFGGTHRDLPGVAAFDACNVSIPCGWWVGEAQRKRVAECIRTGW